MKHVWRVGKPFSISHGISHIYLAYWVIFVNITIKGGFLRIKINVLFRKIKRMCSGKARLATTLLKVAESLI